MWDVWQWLGFSAVLNQWLWWTLNVNSAEGFAPWLGRLHNGHLGFLPGFLLMWKYNKAQCKNRGKKHSQYVKSSCRVSVFYTTGNISYPLLSQFPHFFLQFVQDVKVWLVLFGKLLELDHALVRALLIKSTCTKSQMCWHDEEPSSTSHISLVVCERHVNGLIVAPQRLFKFGAERHFNCFYGFSAYNQNYPHESRYYILTLKLKAKQKQKQTSVVKSSMSTQVL